MKDAIAKSEKLIQWLDAQIDGLEVSSEERVKIASGCLDTALEHHKAILLLVSRSLYGSAFALVRLLFEVYIRGLWLHRCASAAEVELFKAEKLDKGLGMLIGEIEKIEGFEEGILSDTKLKSWKAMNSYTHSGFLQIARRNTVSTIEPNYTDEEIREALDFSAATGLLSALEIANIAKSEGLMKSILEKAEKWSKS